MALTQISTEGIKNGTITGSDLATNIDLVDNQTLRFGTGNDLVLRHTGSASYIENSTGFLFIHGNDIALRSTAQENYIVCDANAEVELYYDGTKKFETTSGGVKVSGNLEADRVKVGDNESIRVGDSNDILLLHDANGSVHGVAGSSYIKCQGVHDNILNIFTASATGKIHLKNNNLNKTMLSANGNGSVDLYYDNSKKFETLSTGVAVTGELDVSGTIDMNTDTGRLKIGAGDDLQIYHDGTNSYIANNGGQLRIWAKTDGYAIIAAPDAQVELYYDNVKKLETTSNGITVSGHYDVGDNSKLLLGNSDDLQIYHDGSHSRIIDGGTGSLMLQSNSDIRLRDNTGSIDFAKFTNGGGVELYHNNVTSLKTTTEGIEIKKTASGQTARLQIEATNGGQAGIELRTSLSGTNRAARIDMYNQNSLQWSIFNDYQQNGTNDFSIRHGAEMAIRALPDAQVELYYDNSKKFETNNGGVQVYGDLRIQDDEHIYFGTGADLEVRVGSNDDGVINQVRGDLKFQKGGSGKFVIKSDGTHFSDDVFPATNNTYDLGSSSLRWRNVYTNDLNLSNEGGSNDVDGTWGSYTIQEGAEDLFLVNKRNGKKYKFNLTEVS